jgi:phosphohistidine phosphatase SixA
MRHYKGLTMSLGLRSQHRFLLLMSLAALGTAQGNPPSNQELLRNLRHGGYVILMRHASSPRDPPNAAAAKAANTHLERKLDEAGQASARAMGEALRRLRIPIGGVFASPTYRALETIQFAQLGHATTFPELGDGGQSMTADKTGSRALWLKAKVAERPSAAKNTIIVTHFPNIMEAYPQDIGGLSDGEAMILRPDGKGSATVVARVKIGDWAQLDKPGDGV